MKKITKHVFKFILAVCVLYMVLKRVVHSLKRNFFLLLCTQRLKIILEHFKFQHKIKYSMYEYDFCIKMLHVLGRIKQVKNYSTVYL